MEHLIAACGTWCGGCLAHRGELAGQAGALLGTVRRQGVLALAKRLEPESAGEIDAFFSVLDRLARTPPCPGCRRGGGVPDCPVRACARLKGHASCAPCPDLEACARGPSDPGRSENLVRLRRQRSALRQDPAPFPFSASGFLTRLTHKYQGWNLDNLRRIRERGERDFLEAMAADPGFRTLEKKCEQDVFGD